MPHLVSEDVGEVGGDRKREATVLLHRQFMTKGHKVLLPGEQSFVGSTAVHPLDHEVPTIYTNGKLPIPQF